MNYQLNQLNQLNQPVNSVNDPNHLNDLSHQIYLAFIENDVIIVLINKGLSLIGRPVSL